MEIKYVKRHFHSLFLYLYHQTVDFGDVSHLFRVTQIIILFERFSIF